MPASHKNRSEKRQLLAIIAKYDAIVNTRKADRQTVATKRKVWNQISSEFNRLPDVRPCSTKQLKRFWTNLKSRDLEIRNTFKRDTNQLDGSGTLSQQFCIADEDGHLDEMTFDSNDSDADPLETQSPTNKFSTEIQHSESEAPIANDRINERLLHRSESSEVNSGKSKCHRTLQLFISYFVVLTVINVQLSKLELSMTHMREVHQLTVQREKLQVRLLEQQIEEQAILHQFRLDNEREMHQLRLKNEQELHIQRMRYEQEQNVLQQGKIHEVHGYPIR